MSPPERELCGIFGPVPSGSEACLDKPGDESHERRATEFRGLPVEPLRQIAGIGKGFPPPFSSIQVLYL